MINHLNSAEQIVIFVLLNAEWQRGKFDLLETASAVIDI